MNRSIYHFYDIFVRSPINAQAAKLFTSKEPETEELSNEEIAYLIGRLQRKRKLLNKIIGVDSKSKRKMQAWKINKGIKNIRETINPRTVDEWKRNGLAINRLNREAGRRNKLQHDPE